MFAYECKLQEHDVSASNNETALFFSTEIENFS